MTAELTILRELPPLPKTHYCWGFVGYRDDCNGGPILPLSDPRLVEYTRICGSLGLAGPIPEKYLPQAVAICEKAGAGIAYNYSLWHYVYPPRPAPPTLPGDDELRLFGQRLVALRDAAKDRVPVQTLLLDCERWNYQTGDGEWNDAINAKYRQGYDLCREVFPDVPVDWAWRGMLPDEMDPTQCPGDSYSEAIYCPSDYDHSARQFRRLAVNAVRDGVSRVLVWFAAGTTGQLNTVPANPDYCEFRWDGDYDSGLSWQWGRDLNRTVYAGRGEHWELTTVPVWFPQPWNCKNWIKHFAAYCRGANWQF